MLTYRAATVADLPAIERMNQSHRPAVGDLDAAATLRLFEMSIYLRCAIDGDRVAGFLLGLGPGADYASLNYAWFSERYDSFIYVDRIVVDEGYRSQGIGQALYEDFAAFGRARDAAVMLAEVNTRPRNEGSLRFHAREGFRDVGTLASPDGTKEVVMLEKALTPARNA